MDDPLRETRCMVLLTLPFPPLPVSVARLEHEDSTVVNDAEALATTHTLLALCLNQAVAQNDPRRNEERRGRQIRVLQTFLHDMAETGFDLDEEALYQFYCKHSLLHMATYFPEGKPPEVRFKPYHLIATGDPGYNKMVEYMAAQSVIFQDAQPKTRAHYDGQSFIELLRQARDRLGHVMTDEEKERVQHEVGEAERVQQEVVEGERMQQEVVEGERMQHEVGEAERVHEVTNNEQTERVHGLNTI
jgi:hypothetical protein